MKIVHINKKNLEREAAIQRMAKEEADKRDKLERKRFLKILAKEAAARKAGLDPNKKAGS